MRTANPATRHSLVERHNGPSPFRSKVEMTRVMGAGAMVRKRLDEITALEEKLAQDGLSKAHRNALRTRLLATKNNLKSWTQYLAEGTQREPRAVMAP